MIAHDYKSINTSPKPCLCKLTALAIAQTICLAAFMAVMWVTICLLMA
jgi:hypothetical protein